MAKSRVLAGAGGRPVLGPSVPVGLDISSIGVRTAVTAIGLRPDRTFDAPAPRSDAPAGWFRRTPTPGEPGASVIVGPADADDGPAVFHRLRLLRPGDEIVVRRADGGDVGFTVTAVGRYPRAAARVTDSADVEWVRRVPPRVGGLLLMCVALLFAGQTLADVLGGWIVPGMDYLPLRHAAEALLAGRSVFGDPLFVYPPTAALMLLPAALGTPAGGFVGWVLAGVAALLLAAGLIARQAPRPRRVAVFAIATMGLLGGVIAVRSVFLGNLSELLVPVAVGVLLSFHRGRWVLGCALLAASLLVKPLLAPLVLVPLLHRRWRPLLVTMVPGGALALLSMLVVPGGRNFPAVLRYCLTGTNLHGTNAVNNLSLRGWAEGRHAPHLLGVAAAAVVLVMIVALVGRRVRAGEKSSPIWLGAVLLLGTFLAGGISEVHFLLTGYALVLLHIVVSWMPPRDWVRFVPGLLLLAAPASYLPLLLGDHTDGQSWLVAAEVLLLAALLATPSARRGPAAGGPPPRSPERVLVPA
jgi:hypothetical protein